MNVNCNIEKKKTTWSTIHVYIHQTHLFKKNNIKIIFLKFDNRTMSSKVELICSPFNEYEFIYVANDIVLYKVVTFDEICN